MTLSEQHLKTIQTDFSDENLPIVIAELEQISRAQTMESAENLENVLGAILSLSKGNVAELRNLVAAAKRDFRDVLYWWYLDNKKTNHPE
ncbi:MAG: hypothetical protein CMK07_08150 [Ponticaulis sp.]|nr:hypothetical protein [Ponticaulis sp.]